MNCRALVCFVIVLCLSAVFAAEGQVRTQKATSSRAPAAPVESEAPISLRDTDGQALSIEQLDVRVATHGPLSLTEMEIVFRNPHRRRIEGRFSCTLPAGATVTRFAREVGDRLQEGEVVERLRATQIYEDAVHRMTDPALLEQDASNVFRARIHPISAQGTVRVIISWTSVLPADADGERRVIVPLQGLDAIGRFRLRAICRLLPGETVRPSSSWLGLLLRKEEAQERGSRVIFSHDEAHENFVPAEDLNLSFRMSEDTPRATRLTAGRWQMIALRPSLPRHRPSDVPTSRIGIYVDTSASLASLGQVRFDAIEALLEGLSRKLPRSAFILDAFDVDVSRIATWRGAPPSRAMGELRQRHFLGATDLEKALRSLGDQARGQPGLYVLVTDGMATLGERETSSLIEAVQPWPEESQLNVLVLGSTWNEAVCRTIAEAGGGRVVQLPLAATWHSDVSQAVDDLLRPIGVGVSLSHEEAEWIEPAQFNDVRSGAELVAFSLLPSDRKSSSSVTVSVAGREQSIIPADVSVPEFSPLVERAAIGAKIAMLERQEGTADSAEERNRLRARRLELSVRHRVMSSLTAMIVLESAAEYRRYGLDRRALTDILVVGDEGVEFHQRRDDKVSEIKPRKPRPTAERREPPLTESGRSRPRRVHTDSYLSRGPAVSMDAEMDAALAFSDDMLAEEVAADSLTRSASQPPPPPPPPPARPARSTLPARPVPPARSAPPPARPASPARSRVARSQAPAMAADVVQQTRPESIEAYYPESPTRTIPEIYEGDDPIERAVGSSRAELIRQAQSHRFSAPIRPHPGSPPPPPAPGTFQAPSWTEQADWIPDGALLRSLRRKVEASPQDRDARNQLCWHLLQAGNWSALRDQALDWQRFDPSNPMVYEFLGEAFHALGDEATSLRAFTSIAEVSPGDAGLLDRAGYLALRSGHLAMGETMFRYALWRRPDNHNIYRGLALALWMQGNHEEAVDVLIEALGRTYHRRYKDVKRVLAEELSMIAGAWMRTEPKRREEIETICRLLRIDPGRRDDLRVTLHWETDNNDVDLHVVDPAGEESYYAHKRTRSGVELYEDLTQGLGPEVTVVPRGRLMKGRYHVGVKYFRAGPMGISRGIVLIHEPPSHGRPNVRIKTFTLLPDTDGRRQDMRHVAVYERGR